MQEESSANYIGKGVVVLTDFYQQYTAPFCVFKDRHQIVCMCGRICSLDKESDNSICFKIRGKSSEYFEYWNFTIH